MKCDRRDAIKGLGLICFIGSGGLLTTLLARKAQGQNLLRPPGALEEADFLASCIKCGQCVQVCPFRSLNLLDLSSGIHTATPFIDPEKRGCYLCDLFPCILCCPSGALDDKVDSIEKVHMGIAYVVNPNNCLNLQHKPVEPEMLDEIISHGNRTDLEKEMNKKLAESLGKICDLCLIPCRVPDRDNAIKLDKNGPVIGPSCVGCGACVEVCPEKIIHIRAGKTFQEFYKLKGDRT